MDGLSAHWSALVGFLIPAHGTYRDANLNILKPNLLYECATLS